MSYLQEPVVLIYSGRKVQTGVVKNFLSPPESQKVFGLSLVDRKDKMSREGDFHMKQTGMLVVSLRGVNLDFGLA